MRTLAALTPASSASRSEEIVVVLLVGQLDQARRYTGRRATVASGMRRHRIASTDEVSGVAHARGRRLGWDRTAHVHECHVPHFSAGGGPYSTTASPISTALFIITPATRGWDRAFRAIARRATRSRLQARRRTLPASPAGARRRTSPCSGTCTGRGGRRQKSMTSSSSIDCPSATARRRPSPPRPCGGGRRRRPRGRSIAGCSSSTSSTSAGNTLKPDTMMRSLARSTR